MVLALCEKDVAEPLYVAVAEARVSDRASAIWLTILFVVVAYFGIVAVVDIIRTGSSFPTAGSLRRFDPVYLTSGVYGHGSISKLQILFFSFIAMGLLVYALLRTAILSDMSEDIVALLGIGGAGAAAAKGTAIARNRLSLKNWRWIVDRGWMTDEMRDKETLPAWSDLVMDGGEMNITKLQMLLFSAVVGFAMLSAGLAGLASFEVPDALLVLLGISQGVYVFGKATTPPIFKELDDALTKLIDAELAFKKVAAEKLTAADLPDDRAATLADCKVVAGAEYEAFIALEQSARNMVPVAFPAAKDLLSLTPDLPTA